MVPVIVTRPPLYWSVWSGEISIFGIALTPTAIVGVGVTLFTPFNTVKVEDDETIKYDYNVLQEI